MRRGRGAVTYACREAGLRGSGWVNSAVVNTAEYEARAPVGNIIYRTVRTIINTSDLVFGAAYPASGCPDISVFDRRAYAALHPTVAAAGPV